MIKTLLKKITILVINTLLLLILLGPSIHAELLFGREYYEKLHEYINKAEDSITAAMYFIIPDPRNEQGPVNIIVDDLIKAHNRGVKVKIVLEDRKMKENKTAYQKLRENNIAVYFDTKEHLMHAKAVSIDDKYVFTGSANLSRAAIDDNYEVSFLEHSVSDAVRLRKFIDSIPVQSEDVFYPQTEGVNISSTFILLPDTGRVLLKNQADKQFDLYLLLLKNAEENDNNNIVIDYDSLAKEMGYKAPDNLGRYRNDHEYYYERIHRSLEKLKKYDLIKYDKNIVTLKIGNDKGFEKGSIVIPYEYWESGYTDKLSMRAKYMYLICLYEASKSSRYPFWFRSQKDMSDIYGISDTTISKGLLELEENGIIEVTRDKLDPADFTNRKANVYTMLSL